MTKQLDVQTAYTSGNFNAVVKNDQNGQYWNTAAPGFEAFNASNIASYGIAMTQDGSTGLWHADVPSTLPAGVYHVLAYKTAGANLAVSDMAVGLVGDDPAFNWTGDNVAAIGITMPDNIAAGSASGLALVGSNMGTVTSVTGNVGGTVVGTPSWYTAPTNLTMAQIATGVWQDTTAGDFTVSGSIGQSLFTGVVPGASGGLFVAGTNDHLTVTNAFLVSGGTTFTNASGVGFTCTSSADNTAAVNFNGNGDGAGLSITSDNIALLVDGSGAGAIFEGNGANLYLASGYGIYSEGASGYSALYLVAGQGTHGLWSVGGAASSGGPAGHGAVFQGGDASTGNFAGGAGMAIFGGPGTSTGRGGDGLDVAAGVAQGAGGGAGIAASGSGDAVSAGAGISAGGGSTSLSGGTSAAGIIATGGSYITTSGAGFGGPGFEAIGGTAHRGGNISGPGMSLSVGTVSQLATLGSYDITLFGSGAMRGYIAGLASGQTFLGQGVEAQTSPTAAQIATAVWQDATAGDFDVAGSIGLSLFTGYAPSSSGGYLTFGTGAGQLTADGHGGMLIGSGFAHGDMGGNNTTLALANNSASVAPFSVTNVNTGGQAAIFSAGNLPPLGDGSLATAVLGDGAESAGSSFTYKTNVHSSIRLVSSAYLAADDAAMLLISNGGYDIYLAGDGLLYGDLGGNVIGAGSGGGPSGLAFGGVGVEADVTQWFGGSAPAIPTAAQTATAVWTDLLTGGDFGTAGSIGHLLDNSIDTNIGSRMATFTVPTNFAALSINSSGQVVLESSGLDQINIESGIVSSASLVNDSGTRLTSINLRQALALILAGEAGKAKLSGNTFNLTAAGGPAGATNPRVSAMTDTSGDRNSLTLTVPN